MKTRSLKLQTLNDLKPWGSKGNTSGLFRTRIFNPTCGECPAVVSVSPICLAFPATCSATGTGRPTLLLLPVLLDQEGLPLWACVYTGCTIAHFCGSFPPSCQILRFILPEIRRRGEWRVMGWVKSKNGVRDDKGSITGKCGEKWRWGGSWDIRNACKTQKLCVIKPPALPRQSSKQHYFCLVTINQ